MTSRLDRFAPQFLGLLRIVTALVYLEHGTQKLLHFPPMGRFGGGASGPAGRAASSAPPPAGPGAPEGMPPSMQAIFLIGGIIEAFGGLALVLGLLTRPVAFIVAGECAVIFWWMHVSHSGNIFPATNGGEAAVLFCFTFLYLVFAGPGAFAVDGLIGRKRP